MLEILYRIYQVATDEEKRKNLEKSNAFGLYSSISKLENNEIAMDCLICDDREQFKNIIRSSYGDNIIFRYTRSLKPGDLYCIVVGEHCYDAERYFQKCTFICDNCKSEVTTYLSHHICFTDYEITSLFYKNNEYKDKKFCSSKCKQDYIKKETEKICPKDDQEFFISREMFNEDCTGYIYKITKKSTGEFYIGQTIYAPVFRWGQHLKTERFPIQHITDYQFEVIEIVPNNVNILEREKFYIQKYYAENPEKSLNMSCTHTLRKLHESGISELVDILPTEEISRTVLIESD